LVTQTGGSPELLATLHRRLALTRRLAHRNSEFRPRAP